MGLVEAACDGDGDGDEANANFEWLYQRTLSLMRDPRFRPMVKALATALLSEQTISGRRAREILDGCLPELPR